MNAAVADQVINAHEAWTARSVYPNDAEYELLQNLHNEVVNADRDHDRSPCWCCCIDCSEDLPPWTPEQVGLLVLHQMAGAGAYLCAAGHHIRPVRLLPTARGWVCPQEGCGYRQLWARTLHLLGNERVPEP